MNSLGIHFHTAFEALTGHTPLIWQARLYARLRHGQGDIPRVCDLPTGLGKTSIIPIWLIALSDQAMEGRIELPRRLAYVVNRRTVVDQATSIVSTMRERLDFDSDGRKAIPETLRVLVSGLHKLSPSLPMLAVSTLRGELADNEQWKEDPARAAIIVGTIDMIGSKLLFSGYGDGRYRRTHHAGLIGQDVLIVHDEAHLTPAFSRLLLGVAEAQKADREPRPVRIMELSATRRDRNEGGDVFRLEPEDEQDAIVTQRIDAGKQLRLHPAEGEKARVAKIVDMAYEHDTSQSKVLVYVRSPEDAIRVSNDLRKKLGVGADARLALLTGTLRGHERDLLVKEHQVYRYFLDPGAQPPATLYLVSTSAGEVGIDIDADQMVCDLTTLDSMVQRLGRVNRLGGKKREARIDVVWIEKEENPGARTSSIDNAVARTLEILCCWAGDADSVLDASPRNVRQLIQELDSEAREEAFAPIPEIRTITDVLLDNWSLTSVEDMPGRPEVAPYLHGCTNDPPETHIVWRKEISLFTRHGVDKVLISDWFDTCRIHSRERLQERTDRAVRHLSRLSREHNKAEEGSEIQAVLLDRHGRAEFLPLSDVSFDRIRDKTVVLPVEAGGLTPEGALDAKALAPCPDIDVADWDDEYGIQRERWLYRSGEPWRRLLSYGPDESCMESPRENWRERTSITLIESDEGLEERCLELVLRMPGKEIAGDDPGIAQLDQTLAEHSDAIARHMDSIGERLGLEQRTKSALVSAAIWHDQGKNREIWQWYANQVPGSEPVAKSKRYRHPRTLAGYRHEFGSLLDAMRDGYLCDDPERDLILHLIAAHHGHARPHFDARSFDRECFSTADNEYATIEVLQRFGRLQNRFGRWGLAWLESLMRCADIAASQPAGDLAGLVQSRGRSDQASIAQTLPTDDATASPKQISL